MVSKIENEKTRTHIDMMIHISGSASWSDSPLFVQKNSKKKKIPSVHSSWTTWSLWSDYRSFPSTEGW